MGQLGTFGDRDARLQTPTIGAEVAATFRLAVPLALTQVGQLAMFTTDLMIIGRLGALELAAGALAHTILFAAFVVGMGLMSAVAPLTAQAVGAGDTQKIRRSLRVGLHAALFLAVPMVALQLGCRPVLNALGQDPAVSALAATYMMTLAWSVVPAWGFMAVRGYMSALDAPNPGLWIMLAGIPLNAALAYLWVFGGGPFPTLGIVGAGIATTVVNSVMFAASLAVVAGAQPYRQYAPLQRLWRADWEQFRRLIWIGLPIAVAFSLESGLFSAASLMAGAISVEALAAHQIALQIAAVVFMLPLGIGMAASVRVGTPMGRGDRIALRQAGFISLGLGSIVAVLTMIATLATTDVIPVLFLGSRTAETAATFDLATVLLVYAAAFFVVDALQCIANGALRGINDTRFSMFAALISFWVIGFGVAWGLAFETSLGARGIWIGLLAGLTAYAILLVARFWWRTRDGS